ncbi:cAMP-binding proteins-catabolite gene activator and regulatory subunit of cAMP-dependent protein kinases [Vibrio cholerae]|nr:cAMP-binding proteins-catabolite gene activator and regulatory subunit of cAMP-dependent protein kinases [Vibrio cholerae]CSB74897.1 cAMP-binding proteins-catabolite gene activator and regulatory subunit of cAMP-dependent protein kinases [Vibrio cholerae]
MQAQFHAYLKQHGFSDAECAQLQSVAQPLELPTRHVLVAQGETTPFAYWVLAGLCHACYLTEEGKSFSKEFYWEQDWAIGFESLLREQASPFMLETLSPVQLMGVPIEVLREWRSSGHPLYQRLLETQLLYKEQKERFMLLYRPEQRYQVMCTQFPDLMARLCDHHIAA